MTERAREYGWRRYTDDAGETRWMHPDGGWAELRNEDEFAAALDADAERYRAARAERWEAA